MQVWESTPPDRNPGPERETRESTWRNGIPPWATTVRPRCATRDLWSRSRAPGRRHRADRPAGGRLRNEDRETARARLVLLCTHHPECHQPPISGWPRTKVLPGLDVRFELA